MKTNQYFAATILSALVFFSLHGDRALAQSTRTDNQIGYYQQMLKRNPRNAKAYYGLGDALIRKARETGDPAYFNRAEESLKKSLEIAPKNAGAMRYLAYVFYSRHEFEAAADHARKAIEMNPTDGDAYGVLGDALLEVGEYGRAEEVYKKMMELEESLYSYSRLAGLKSMRGDSAGAIVDLERAIATGKAAKQPAESIAWAEWQLGSDHFVLGKVEKAETYYRQSLETYPNYYRALAGMAQVRAAQKNYGEAILLYQKAIGILPMPDFAAALGDIYIKIGKPELAKQQYELVQYIGRLNSLNQALYNRELAYFYADHDMKLAKSLELAKRELDYRKDIYAYDLLAWSLYRNDKVEEARDAIEKALKLGTQDAKLFFHAGMIHHRLGEKEKANEYLAKAIATNPHFHILYAETAQKTLEQLEQPMAQVGMELRGLRREEK
jgi:tetratricopeptide (TPR) repeat protein